MCVCVCVCVCREHRIEQLAVPKTVLLQKYEEVCVCTHKYTHTRARENQLTSMLMSWCVRAQNSFWVVRHAVHVRVCVWCVSGSCSTGGA